MDGLGTALALALALTRERESEREAGKKPRSACCAVSAPPMPPPQPSRPTLCRAAADNDTFFSEALFSERLQMDLANRAPIVSTSRWKIKF